jgi:CRISPR-associated protein Csx16
MTTYVVTRHKGALDWLEQQGVLADRVSDHLSDRDIEQLLPRDRVVGILPLPDVAAVCAKGARFFHLSVDVPRPLRGVELSASTLSELGASLIEYRVQRID